MNYSIIIPVHNEVGMLRQLLNELEPFSKENDIIIVDDGSSDGSEEILSACDFIQYLRINKNSGKGNAICKGIQHATQEYIILFDGDLELKTIDLSKLMIIDPPTVQVVFGYRVENMGTFTSVMNFGNFFLNGLFNFVNQSRYHDILCGSKAFQRSILDLNKIQSTSFDIDVELGGYFAKQKNLTIKEVPMHYNRRNHIEGKKLKISDGWAILSRIFNTK